MLSARKVVSCGFCGILGHRTTGCAYKLSIGTEIHGDDSIECLEKHCPFKIIDSEQASNVYREFINNRTKIKHIRCQNLLYSTNPQCNICPNVENLIVKISGFDKDGLVVNGYSNVLIELTLVIKFINQKKDIVLTLFFTTLKESCSGKEYYDIKHSDKTQMSNELQVQLLELMNKMSKP